MSFRPAVILTGCMLAAVLSGCGASVVPQIRSDASRVAAARTLYDKGEYTLAVDVLSSYALTGTGNADIDQAVYLLGLSYLRQKDWTNAQTQFERIQRDYPESDSAAAAAYQLGEALFGQSRPSDFDQDFTLKALGQWENYLRSSPADVYAKPAELRIAECRTRLARKLWRSGDLYTKQKLYQPARQFFRDIINDYSDTPVLGDAIIGDAIANAHLGQRDSSLAVLQDLERQFPGTPLGVKAAAVRAKMVHWPATGDRVRRGHKPIEAPVPQLPATQTPSSGTSYAP